MIWKAIQGNFFWNYEVSDNGNIRHDNYIVPQSNSNGYKLVSLKLRDGKYKQYRVHRLVAMTFIPNPYNFPQINHKDENKSNNCVDNLEWCTALYNNTYGSRPNRIRESNSRRGCPDTVRNKIRHTVTLKQGKGVEQYDLNGNLLNVFQSTMDAERNTGIPHNIISAICRGKRTNKNFIFKYS